MRELLLIFIGLCIGILMGTWSAWQIISYVRTDHRQRYQRRFYFRIALAVGLIALADLSKVVRDLVIFLSV